MKTTTSIFLFLLFVSCNNKKINIDYKKTEKLIAFDNRAEFKVPKGLFVKVDEYNFYSKKLDAKIKIITDIYETTSKDAAIEIYKEKTKSIDVKYKDDWFIINSRNISNKTITTSKGFFLEYSKNFYDEENPIKEKRNIPDTVILWTKLGIIQIEYPEKYKNEFSLLIPYIFKSFKCDFGQF